MNYTIPDYYKKFHCIAGDCPDTCCAGWAIMIDDGSLKRYRELAGPLGNRLRNSIDWKESSFQQYDHRCAFLNEENLCDLYAEGGAGMLCRTCRNYPRHIEEFEGIREISLSLSCMEAAKLILGCEEPVRFLTMGKGGEEEYPDFDFFLYTKLADARDVMMRILQNREVPMRIRMSMVLALGHDLQRRIRVGELYQIDELLARYERPGAAKRFEEEMAKYEITGQERFGLMEEMFGLFEKLEVLKDDFPDYIKHMKEVLFAGGSNAYCWNYQEFEQQAGAESLFKETWERYGEQLMVYFVFTYFCGAVYDEQAYGKVKLAVISTLLIQEMCRAVWQEKARKGQEGEFSFDDLIDIAHRYSREAEHSDHNLNVLEQLWKKEECYRLEKLLSVI